MKFLLCEKESGGIKYCQVWTVGVCVRMSTHVCALVREEEEEGEEEDKKEDEEEDEEEDEDEEEGADEEQ